jgi:hypothetical protein
MVLLLYLLAKAAAYIGWCWLGVRWFRPGVPDLISSAVGWGLGRLALGIGLGLFILFAALSMNNATRNAPATYFAIYVPVRILEWYLWYRLMRRVPWDRKAAFWILGGIVVSCLADLPLGLSGGGVVPVGRPFC